MRVPSPRSGAAAILALFATSAVSAQFFVRYSPLPRTVDLLEVDSTADGVWRKADLNQDGDYNDTGEISVYYDDTLGTITLGNPNCIAVAPGGVTFVGDSTEDIVMRLVDLNGDGDALDQGEHTVFFNTVTNGSGVVGASIQGLTADVQGNLFLACSNASSTGDDVIIRIRDGNGDGDANDPGEAIVYHQVPGGTVSVGASIPTEVRIGTDGLIYYCENGVNGNPAKGVYRLIDNNSDGDANDPGESSLYWAPPQPAGASPFFWGLEILPDGSFLVTDHSSNETIFMGRDVNGDNSISMSETTTFYRTSGSTWWDVALRDDGVVFICEDQTPDRLLALVDNNGDGDALDAGESWEAYNDTVAPIATRPRGAAFMPGSLLDASPGAVPPGGNFTVSVTTPGPNQPVGLVIGFGLLPQPLALPPVGELRINAAGGIVLPLVNSDAQGFFVLQSSIPNNAALSGLTIGFQAIAGDPARLYTSTADTLTIL